MRTVTCFGDLCAVGQSAFPNAPLGSSVTQHRLSVHRRQVELVTNDTEQNAQMYLNVAYRQETS